MHDWTARHDYLVGIDSDGCVFDTMELKHKECFIPNTIKHYELQAVSHFARQAAEFVNLYSQSRGINRFPALIETFQWLNRRPEVIARQFRVEIPDSLRRWIETEENLGNAALEAKVDQSGDPELARALRWSTQINQTVAEMVRKVPPFPDVQRCLQRLAPSADLMVCSATPLQALKSEWTEHGIHQYVQQIFGQEAGTKRSILKLARNYDRDRTLMVGDAPGDYRAAQENDCLFFPIMPGAEHVSWSRLYEEGIDRFLNHRFAGDYQQQLLDEFLQRLPQRPPWPVVDVSVG